MTRLQATRTFLFGKKKPKEKHFPASVSPDSGYGEVSTGVQPPSLMRSKGRNDNNTSHRNTIDSESVKQHVTGTGRKRSGSLSKLVQAVRIPLRSRSISDAAPRTISSSSDTLSLMGEWRDSDRQRLSSRTPSNVDSDMGGVDSTRSEASGDGGDQPILEMDEVMELLRLHVRASLAHLPQGVWTMGETKSDALRTGVGHGATCAQVLTVVHEEMAPFLRRPSDPLSDILDPTYSCSASIERCNSARDCGDVLDDHCPTVVQLDAGIIAASSLSWRDLLCWLTVAILFGAGLFFIGKTAILIMLMTRYSLVLDAFGMVPSLVSPWITVGAACCMLLFMLCFRIQVEWAFASECDSSEELFARLFL